MIRPWDKQPGETPKAFEAFEYVLRQWPHHNVAKAYRELSGKPNARQLSGRWSQWSRDYSWNERLEAYDQWRQEQKQQAQMEEAGEAYKAELEAFRKMHESAGKSAFNNVLLLSKALQDYAEGFRVNPETGKPTRSIMSAGEAKQVSGVISDFMKHGPSVWAAALGIPDIQAQIEANGKKE